MAGLVMPWTENVVRATDEIPRYKRGQSYKSLANLDVVPKDLPVPLGSALSKPLASLSASRHPGSACSLKESHCTLQIHVDKSAKLATFLHTKKLGD